MFGTQNDGFEEKDRRAAKATILNNQNAMMSRGMASFGKSANKNNDLGELSDEEDDGLNSIMLNLQ